MPINAISSYLPEASSAVLKSTEKNKKNWLEHLTKYVTTTDGAADLFGVVETGMEYLKKWPLKLKQRDLANKVQNVANVAGNALVFPDIISDGNHVRKSMLSLKKIHADEKKSPDHAGKIHQGVKKFFVNALYLFGDVARAAGFMHENALINLGKGLTAANGVYNGSYLVVNTIEAVEKVKGIKQNKKRIANSHSEHEKSYLSQKNKLKMLKTVQKTASIGLSLIGLASLAFSFSLSGSGVIPGIVLILSTSYLALNINNYFFGIVIKDNYKR
jgi:hypothetical protein